MRSSIRYALILALAVVVVPSVAGAQTPPETIEFYGSDTIGSIRIVFDVNGTVLGRRDFTPFGTPVVPAPAMPKEGFSGNEKDDETDLSYFHARMFQARTGRFNRPDPIGAGLSQPQRWNRYAYASNSPLGRQDFWGLSDCPTDYCEVVNVPGDPTYSSGVGGNDGGDILIIITEPGSGDNTGSGVGSGDTTVENPLTEPQVQTPTNVPPSMQPKLRAALNKAFEEMMRRLKSPACADLFGGTDVVEPAVNNANYRFLPLGPPSQQPSGAWSVTGAATISNATPQLVLINSQGPFLNTTLLTSSGPQDFGVYNQHGTSNAAFILLHEAGHLTHVFGPDAGNANLTAKYNLMVYNSCFK